MVQSINDSNFKGIVADNAVTVVKFSADWCQPCKIIAAAYDELSDTVDAEVILCQCSVDEEPELVETLSIRSVPTIVVFVKGEETERFTGTDCVTKLESYLPTIQL